MVIDAVAVEPVDPLVAAVRRHGERGARERFGAREQPRAALGKGGRALAGQQVQVTRGELGAHPLRLQVGFEVRRRAAVGQQQCTQSGIELPTAVRVHHRYAQTLFEDAGGVGRHRARREAADVLMMQAHRGQCEQVRARVQRVRTVFEE